MEHSGCIETGLDVAKSLHSSYPTAGRMIGCSILDAVDNRGALCSVTYHKRTAHLQLVLLLGLA